MQGPDAGSVKEPVICAVPGELSHPTIVIETGWSEPYDELHEVMNIWLMGGDGDANVVILIYWRKFMRSNRVKGTVEVYTRNEDGIPVRRQNETIFPAPDPAQAASQALKVGRKALFGSTVFPDCDPREIFEIP